MLFIHVICYGIGYVGIIMLQIDTPEASVQVPRAIQILKLLGIANCHRGVLESNHVLYVA
jgi:hypothetical protein